MKILVTGINGFIGRHLASSLIAKGHYVVGLGRQRECQVPGVFAYFCGDVLDKRILEDAVEDADAVVHLAALTAHKDIVNNKFAALETNFMSTKNALDVFLKSASCKKFIYSSSGKVYGDIKALPITEDHPTAPLNILGKSKLITEKLIDYYSDPKVPKSYIVLRIFNVYGPEQKDNFLVPTILSQARKSSVIDLGDIKAKRDYTYVDDVVDAFIMAIEKGTSCGLSVYNICSGRPASAEEIVSIVSKIKGSSIKINANPAMIRRDERDEEYGSYRKAKKELGWEPKVGLETGLEKTFKNPR